MKIVMNNNGLKALANDEGKIISPWLKDFVEGVGLLANPPQSNYFIGIDTRGKQAIYDKDGNQISDKFDYINPKGLVSGQSQYYIGRKKIAGLSYERIYDKDGNPISPRFSGILPDGLVTGTRDFYVGWKTSLKHGGRFVESLMDKNGVNVLGRDVKYINAIDFLRGESNTFTFDASGILSNFGNDKIFIMEYNKTEDNRHRFMIKGYQLPSYPQSTIRGAVGAIATETRQTFKDLVSDFLGVVKSLKSLVGFGNVFNAYKQASNLYLNQLVGKKPPSLESDQAYSIVNTKDGKRVLADKNGVLITPPFKSIRGGALYGKSPYFIAKREDGKEAIFSADNSKQPISDWHSYVSLDGLVNGESPYYMYGDYSKVEGRGLYNIKDIAGNKLLDRDYRKIEAYGFLIGHSNTVEVDTSRRGIADVVVGNMKNDVNMEKIDLSDKVEQTTKVLGQETTEDPSWQPNL